MDKYEGFGEFVEARGAALSRTAFLLYGNHADAQDLLQEALAKTARHWRKVVDGNPEAYVRRVMINQRTSWWRRFGRREQAVAEPPESTTSDHSESSTTRLTLLRALAELAPRQRAVVVLRFYEDMSVAEVADILNVSQGTVKSQSHAALARLRRILADSRFEELELA